MSGEHAWVIHHPAFEVDTVRPSHAVQPWGGHRRFAYDLVRFIRPSRIVELGVHWGTSFFAFAQAIKDAGLDTELIGVDTFEGEEHAGCYGEEVIQEVRRVCADHFADQSITLHRMLFLDACEQVADGSVDLLHIDGLHTYEACMEDFTTWLPKLRDDAVVLVHDVAEDSGYGSVKAWAELTERYPSFSFSHSWGLGVLFPRGERWLRAMRGQNLDDRISLYTERAERELTQIKLTDAQSMARERYEALRAQDRIIEQKKAELETARRQRTEAVQRQQAVIESKSERIERLQHRIDATEQVVQRKDKTLREQRERLERRAGIIQNQKDAITLRDAVIHRLEDDAKRRDAQGEALAALVAQTQSCLADVTERLGEHRAELADVSERLGQAEALIAYHRRNWERVDRVKRFFGPIARPIRAVWRALSGRGQ